MLPTSFKKAINWDGLSPSEFLFYNITDDIEFDSEKESFAYIKEYAKRSNQNAIYYPICGYYIAIDVACDITQGIEKEILKKSDALKLIEISKKRGFYDGLSDDWKELNQLIEEKFPCFSRENDADCINCCNCD